MKITVKQLRSIIKEELTRLLESHEPPGIEPIKDVIDSKELLKIADQIKRMDSGKLPAADTIKYYEKALTPELRSAIKLALTLASAQQLTGLQHEAYFGEVDSMTGTFVSTLIKDPIDALLKLKEKLARTKDVRDVGVVALLLREMHSIMEDLVNKNAPKGQARRSGLLGFMGL